MNDNYNYFFQTTTEDQASRVLFLDETNLRAGINEDTPAYDLEVSSTIKTSNVMTNAINLYNSNSSSNYHNTLYINTFGLNSPLPNSGTASNNKWFGNNFSNTNINWDIRLRRNAPIHHSWVQADPLSNMIWVDKWGAIGATAGGIAGGLTAAVSAATIYSAPFTSPSGTKAFDIATGISGASAGDDAYALGISVGKEWGIYSGTIEAGKDASDAGRSAVETSLNMGIENEDSSLLGDTELDASGLGTAAGTAVILGTGGLPAWLGMGWFQKGKPLGEELGKLCGWAVGAADLAKKNSNVLYPKLDNIEYASNTARWASNAGNYASNTARWASNTGNYASNTASWSSNEADWASNTARFSSNASVYGSNTARWASNMADWGSNTADWASNKANWASNTAQWSSNKADWASNTAQSASNRAFTDRFWTNNLSLLYSLCNVSIGKNTNANLKLDIDGAVHIGGENGVPYNLTQGLYLNWINGTAYMINNRGASGGDFLYQTYNGLGLEKTIVKIDNLGRVGINTTTPTYDLDVNGNANAYSLRENEVSLITKYALSNTLSNYALSNTVEALSNRLQGLSNSHLGLSNSHLALSNMVLALSNAILTEKTRLDGINSTQDTQIGTAQTTANAAQTSATAAGAAAATAEATAIASGLAAGVAQTTANTALTVGTGAAAVSATNATAITGLIAGVAAAQGTADHASNALPNYATSNMLSNVNTAFITFSNWSSNTLSNQNSNLITFSNWTNTQYACSNQLSNYTLSNVFTTYSNQMTISITTSNITACNASLSNLTVASTITSSNIVASNIGLGTATPREQVEATGAIRAPTFLSSSTGHYFGNGWKWTGTQWSNYSTGGGFTIRNGGASENFQLSTGSNNLVQRLTVLSTGNVGIGTANPTFLLDTSNSGSNGIRSTACNGNGDFRAPNVFLNTASNNPAIMTLLAPNLASNSVNRASFNLGVNHTNGDLLQFIYNYIGTGSMSNSLTIGFWGGLNVMTLMNNSNVGIGTTIPTQRLDVNGDVLLRSNLTTSNINACNIVASSNITIAGTTIYTLFAPSNQLSNYALSNQLSNYALSNQLSNYAPSNQLSNYTLGTTLTSFSNFISTQYALSNAMSNWNFASNTAIWSSNNFANYSLGTSFTAYSNFVNTQYAPSNTLSNVNSNFIGYSNWSSNVLSNLNSNFITYSNWSSNQLSNLNSNLITFSNWTNTQYARSNQLSNYTLQTTFTSYSNYADGAFRKTSVNVPWTQISGKPNFSDCNDSLSIGGTVLGAAGLALGGLALLNQNGQLTDMLANVANSLRINPSGYSRFNEGIELTEPLTNTRRISIDPSGSISALTGAFNYSSFAEGLKVGLLSLTLSNDLIIWTSNTTSNMVLSSNALVVRNSQPFTFSNANVIFANCNVGIGTSNPTYRLDVSGTARITSNLVAGDIFLYDRGYYLRGEGDRNHALLFNSVVDGTMLRGNGGGVLATTASNALWWRNNGFVGIGHNASNPAYLLDVNGTAEVNNLISTGSISIGTSNIAPLSTNVITANLVGTTFFGSTTSNMYLYRVINTDIDPNSNQDIGGIILRNYNTGGSANYHFIDRQLYGLGFVVRNGLSSNIEALNIDNLGRVGIGTSNPSYRLDINGTMRSTSNALINDNMLLGEQGYGTTYTGFRHSSVATNSYAILQENNGRTYINASNTQNITFRLNNIDQGVWNSNGLGVGTITPQEAIHSTGFIRGLSFITSDFGTYYANGWKWTGTQWSNYGTHGGFVLRNGGSNEPFQILTGSNNLALQASMTANGNFGLGTSTPSFPLDISNTGSNGIRVSSCNANGDFRANCAFINTASNNPAVISLLTPNIPTSGTNRCSFNLGRDFNNGNLCQMIYNYFGSANSNNSLSISFWGGSPVMNIQNGGSIGIGVFTPTARLDINGDVLARSNLTTSNINACNITATSNITLAGTSLYTLFAPSNATTTNFNTFSNWISPITTSASNTANTDRNWTFGNSFVYTSSNVCVGQSNGDACFTVDGTDNTLNGTGACISLGNRFSTNQNRWYWRVGSLVSGPARSHTPDGWLSLADKTNYRMFFGTNGRVGIGTCNLNYTLDVVGNINATTGYFSNGTSLDTIYAPSNHTHTVMNLMRFGDWGYGTDFTGIGHCNLSGVGNYGFLQSRLGDTYINAPTGRSLQLRINNNDRFILNSAGDISMTNRGGTYSISVGTRAGVSNSNWADFDTTNGGGFYFWEQIETPARLTAERAHITNGFEGVSLWGNGNSNYKWNMYHDVGGEGDSCGNFNWAADTDGANTQIQIAYLEDDVNVGGRKLNFTGSHRCVEEGNTINPETDWGLIVIASGKYCSLLPKIKKKQIENILIDEALPTITLSTTRKQKNVFGVICQGEELSKNKNRRVFHMGNFKSCIRKDKDDKNRIECNALGEGGIWVCDTNGNFENGDYITTSTQAGYGERQDEPYVCNYTVGKITCDVDWTDINLDKKFQMRTINGRKAVFVGCIYVCG